MDYKLEKPVRLDDKNESKSLYSWYLEELDRNTKQLGPQYIPWDWDLYFEASSLAVTRSLEIEADKGSKLRQLISGSLHPETKDRRAAATYSFFGTDRTVGNFSISIVRSADDQDSVELSGFPAYEYEWDFETKERSDLLEVSVVLSAAKFDTLADMVERGSRTTMLRLGKVSGFYSEWSPSIRTQNIKVLASLQDQNVKMEAGGEIVPPVLGRVGEFAFSLVKGEGKKEATGDEVIAAPPTDAQPVEKSSSAIIDLARLEKKIAGLQVPLWIAVGLLAVSLFFR
ncbi:hypothetical protein E0J20_09340 [Rhizobium leguminosarum bv. viciae]|nr:hypothetical protein E0J20_09340 [Rhizobium leguminosarum bv. viciae]